MSWKYSSEELSLEVMMIDSLKSENLLNNEEQIKKGESLHREVNHSTESEDEDDEDEEAFINEEE
ncbi:hypothetical protein Glove_504g8 [Diversispora epigaea]|uniref:Uncharacterized protein n=1 Tax=Diversispora epigaea TaxID=1348612 RepID=A0A397GMB5_9GLOM|nr:hypothetical protein Glove_504g8 [Diversispora epigaea]